MASWVATGAGDSSYNGTYTETGSTQNGQPIYKNENNRYLFYTYDEIGMFYEWAMDTSAKTSVFDSIMDLAYYNGTSLPGTWYTGYGTSPAPTLSEGASGTTYNASASLSAAGGIYASANALYSGAATLSASSSLVITTLDSDWFSYYLLSMDYSPLGKDAPLTALRKIRSSFSMAESYLNYDMAYMDSTLYELAGGVVFGMDVTASGLNITVSPGVAIINNVVVEDSGVSLGVNDNSSGYILLCYNNYGHKYHVGSLSNVPSDYSYIILATYTASNGSVQISYSSRNDATTLYNGSISGSLSEYVNPYETKIVEVDHEADGKVVIPGYITINVARDYYSGYYYTNNVTARVYKQETVTPTSFEIEIINTMGWGTTADISWVRTGIINTNPVG